MGLDIYHEKAVIEKPDIYDLFDYGNKVYESNAGYLKKRFGYFNVKFEHFEKYIQLIDVPVEIKSVVIAKGKKCLDRVKEHFKLSDIEIIAKESDDQLMDQLFKFEKKNSLQELGKCFQDIQHLDWKILKYYELEKHEGFYYKQVGHQRKGMNPKFWERFRKIDDEIFNFALKEDFEHAMSCVDFYWENDTQEIVDLRKRKFKENFIDKFESGASFLSISY